AWRRCARASNSLVKATEGVLGTWKSSQSSAEHLGLGMEKPPEKGIGVLLCNRPSSEPDARPADDRRSLSNSSSTNSSSNIAAGAEGLQAKSQELTPDGEGRAADVRSDDLVGPEGPRRAEQLLSARDRCAITPLQTNRRTDRRSVPESAGRGPADLRDGHEVPALHRAAGRPDVARPPAPRGLALHRRLQRPGRADRHRVRVPGRAGPVVARTSPTRSAARRAEDRAVAHRLLRAN